MEPEDTRARLIRLARTIVERRLQGETVRIEDYRAEAGDAFTELKHLVGQSSTWGDPKAPPERIGAYRIVREIGRGAMGIVYEAVQEPFDRKVALKVLPFDAILTPEIVERFRREACAVASVHHDHVVTAYEGGETGGRPYFSMALVEGGSLDGLVRELEGLSEASPGRGANRVLDSHGLPTVSGTWGGPTTVYARRIADAVAGVADALHVLHDSDTYHRDVKPSNVLVAAGGRLQLADFGLVRAPGPALTKTGEIVGTPLYMPPEKLGALAGSGAPPSPATNPGTPPRPHDKRSDVYSLGAVLFELLAMRRVRPGELWATVAGQPEAPAGAIRGLSARMPEDIKRVVKKALEIRPEDRYPSASALRDDLMAFAAGRPVSVRPIGPLGRAGRWVRRRWIPVAAAAVVILALGALWWRLPGYATIRSWPKARVTVDGRDRGWTPLKKLELAAGAHEVRLNREGFKPLEETIDVGRGSTGVSDFLLWPSNSEDDAAYERMAETVDIGIRRMDVRRSRQIPEGPVVLPLFPRGRYLDAPRSLHVWAQEPVDSYFAVLVAAGEPERVLHRWPLKVARAGTDIPVPEDLRSRLERGQEYRIQVLDADGREVSAGGFTLLPATDADLLRADLDAKLAPLGKDYPWTAVLRAEFLAGQGLDGEAFEASRAAGGATSPGAATLRLQLAALQGAGLKEQGPWAGLVDAYLGPDR